MEKLNKWNWSQIYDSKNIITVDVSVSNVTVMVDDYGWLYENASKHLFLYEKWGNVWK